MHLYDFFISCRTYQGISINRQVIPTTKNLKSTAYVTVLFIIGVDQSSIFLVKLLLSFWLVYNSPITI